MLTFLKVLHFYFLFLKLLILIFHVVRVGIGIAGLQGFRRAVLRFLGWAVLALAVLAWFSRFQFSGFFPGLYLGTEANLSTSESVSLLLLLLSYQLFIFNFLPDSSLLN
jgi:hypothetical protein